MLFPYFSMKCNFYFFLTWDGSYVFIAFYVWSKTSKYHQAGMKPFKHSMGQNSLHSHLGLTCKPCKYVWQWNWLRWKNVLEKLLLLSKLKIEIYWMIRCFILMYILQVNLVLSMSTKLNCCNFHRCWDFFHLFLYRGYALKLFYSELYSSLVLL